MVHSFDKIVWLGFGLGLEKWHWMSHKCWPKFSDIECQIIDLYILPTEQKKIFKNVDDQNIIFQLGDKQKCCENLSDKKVI